MAGALDIIGLEDYYAVVDSAGEIVDSFNTEEEAEEYIRRYNSIR